MLINSRIQLFRETNMAICILLQFLTFTRPLTSRLLDLCARACKCDKVGGGTGLNASLVLDWLQKQHPDIYSTCSYTLLDVSETQANLQRRATASHGARVRVIVSQNGNWRDALKNDVVTNPSSSNNKSNGSRIKQASKIPRSQRNPAGRSMGNSRSSSIKNKNQNSGGSATSTSRDVSGYDVHILALELLDNLPHDRVEARSTPSSGDASVALHEAHVVSSATADASSITASTSSSHRVSDSSHGYNGSEWMEEMRPLRDPLIKRCVDLRPGLADALLAQAAPQSLKGVMSGLGNMFQGFWPFRQDTVTSKTSAEGRYEAFPESNGTSLTASVSDSDGHVAAFIPTGCLALFQELHACFPRHALLLADFDALPDPDLSWVHLPHIMPATTPKERIEAEAAANAALSFIESGASPLGCLGAPLVSERLQSGANRDHPTYLVPMGSADILFPTTFDWVAALYRGAAEDASSSSSREIKEIFLDNERDCVGAAGLATAGAAASQVEQVQISKPTVTTSVVKQRTFLEAHVLDRTLTTTKSGYNPLLMDFSNTTVFVGEVDCCLEEPSS